MIIGAAYHDVAGTGLWRAQRSVLGADAAGAPDLDHLDQELGEYADEIKALHHGGAEHWHTLVQQTAPMWLDYPGLPASALEGITVPALVLAADRDEFVDLDLSIDLYRRLPNAELAVCPASDHSAPMIPQRAAIFAAVIRDFVERHAAHAPQ